METTVQIMNTPDAYQYLSAFLEKEKERSTSLQILGFYIPSILFEVANLYKIL